MKPVNLNRILLELEKKYIKRALQESGDNVSKAADLLGLKRTSLVMRLKSLDLALPRAQYKPRVLEDVKRIHPSLIRHSNDLEGTL